MVNQETPPHRSHPRDVFFDTTTMNRKIGRQAGNASAFILLMSAFKILQQFGGIAIIARLVPPDEYGIFALAMPVVAISLSLSSMGLPQAIVQSRTISHMQVSTLFWINLAFATLAAGIVFACAGFAGEVFHEPRVTPVFQVIGLSILFGAVTGQYASIMRRKLRVKVSEFLILCGETVALIIAIMGALAGMGYWALVLQQILGPLISMVLMMIVTKWLPSSPLHARFGEVREALSFGGYIAGMSIVTQLTQYAGIMVIGTQGNPANTGLFQRVRLLSEMPLRRVLIPLGNAFIPTMSRLQDDPEALRTMFVRLISRANLVVLPIAVLMAAGAVPIVAILLGETWEGAGPLLFWMSLFAFRASANSGLQNALIACGKSRPLFFNSLLRLAIVGLTLYISSDYGLLVMTASYAVVEFIITMPMMVFLAVRHTPITASCIRRSSGLDLLIAMTITAGLVFIANPLLAPLPALWHLTILIGLTGLCYAIRIGFTKSMRADVLGLLRRKRKP